MEKIHIEVTLLGFLKIHAGAGVVTLRVSPGSTVRDLLGDLNLKRDVVLNAAVNDVFTGIDTVLHDGDKVKLLPYTGGG